MSDPIALPQAFDADSLSVMAPEQVQALVGSLWKANAELHELNTSLGQARLKLMQSERLASIGQLAAGVAHEINNPIGFIFSNFGTLEGYLQALFEMLDAYERALPLVSDATTVARLRDLSERLEMGYLKEDIPQLMSESRDGIQRVRKIVQDLKDFSRVDAPQAWEWVQLHKGIDSTLNMVNNEVKYRADVVKDYGELPDVRCLPSELNQVFMNLLVNAAHAITAERGTITVRTRHEGANVWVEVADDGSGIAPEHLSRLFDPFFTTKPVGQGTGLGLSLAYGIVQKHAGRITVTSAPGEGTCFRVTLPVAGPPAEPGSDQTAA